MITLYDEILASNASLLNTDSGQYIEATPEVLAIFKRHAVKPALIKQDGGSWVDVTELYRSYWGD